MIGRRIGSYEVVAKLGEGGMGEVYRARDIKLDRDVAIKVLPESFAADADRVARFTREAQVLASLNHPNIAAIYGIEETTSEVGRGVSGAGPTSEVVSRALVMELVEGRDLSEIIAAGGIPLTDAIAIARQIADALEAAHEQGIVHRDLKPQNIKVREDGTVKVLDFGLARTLDPGPGTLDPSHSPTMTARATQMGMIIGTAAYMAPEQAKGKPVDKRADIWAYGVVLYEMLTGRRCFDGEDISTTLAAVLMREPDFTALPANTPPAVASLVRRCLERDPKQRLRDIGEARLLLSNPQTMSGSPQPGAAGAAAAPDRSRISARVAWAVAAVSVVAAGALGVSLYRSGSGSNTDSLAPIRFTVSPPAGGRLASAGGTDAAPMLSPDGRMLVYGVATGTDGLDVNAIGDNAVRTLWLRRLDTLESKPLEGTLGASWPFWSPDSQSIAFIYQDELRAVASDGGAIRTIAKVGTGGHRGTWNQHGDIVIGLNGPNGRRLMRLSANGGEPTVVREPDPSRGEYSLGLPDFLPDGRHFLYGLRTNASLATRLMVASLDGGEPVYLRDVDSHATYANDYLLFAIDGHLEAQAFDLERPAMIGSSRIVANDFARSSIQRPPSLFSASQTGLVEYQAISMQPSQLVLVDRRGVVTRSVVDDGQTYVNPVFSPDGRSIAVDRFERTKGDTGIWVYDLERRAAAPLAPSVPTDASSAWSRDSQLIVFGAPAKDGWGLYRQRVNATTPAELLTTLTRSGFPYDVSPDGAQVLFTTSRPGFGSEIDAFDVVRKSTLSVVSTPAPDVHGRYSPDGKWVAYMSQDSGRREVYVQSTLDDKMRRMVSIGGGEMPRWRADGRELFYVAGPTVYVVPITPGPTLRIGTPTALFTNERRGNWAGPGPYSGHFDVAPDGQSFALVLLKDGPGQSPMTVIANWPSLLKKTEKER